MLWAEAHGAFGQGCGEGEGDPGHGVCVRSRLCEPTDTHRRRIPAKKLSVKIPALHCKTRRIEAGTYEVSVGDGASSALAPQRVVVTGKAVVLPL